MNVIFDMDGTLSNDDWRVHLRERDEEGKVDWDAYHREGIHDLKIDNMCVLYNALAQCGFGMIIMTGRPIKYRQQTMRWLFDQNIIFNSLLMRPDRDYSPNEKLKLRLLSENGLTPNNVVFIYDDNERVILLLRDHGYVTFHVVIP